MRFAGIDIGSRTIELVVVDEAGRIKDSLQADTGYDPMAEAGKLVDRIGFDRIMATGYGRNLFEISFDAPTVTEIKAHAWGARTSFPDARTVLAEKLGRKVLIPENPQFVGALGAALLIKESA